MNKLIDCFDNVMSRFERDESPKSLRKQETFDVHGDTVLYGSSVIFAGALLISIAFGLFVGGI